MLNQKILSAENTIFRIIFTLVKTYINTYLHEKTLFFHICMFFKFDSCCKKSKESLSRRFENYKYDID